MTGPSMETTGAFDVSLEANYRQIRQMLKLGPLSHHVRREEILVRKGEVVAHQEKAGRPAKSDNLSKYSTKAATDLGVDERTIRRDLARGKKIAPEVLAEVAGTALDKGVVLDELARTPAEDQRAKLAEITLRRQEAERARKDTEAVNRATDRDSQNSHALFRVIRIPFGRQGGQAGWAPAAHKCSHRRRRARLLDAVICCQARRHKASVAVLKCVPVFRSSGPRPFDFL